MKYGRPQPTQTYSPTAKAAADTRVASRLFAERPSLGVSKPKPHICPAKMFARHPDKGLRALAEAQAKEQHDLNDYLAHGCVHAGKCRAKVCKPMKVRYPESLFAKNDNTMRVAVGLKRQARIDARGW